MSLLDFINERGGIEFLIEFAKFDLDTVRSVMDMEEVAIQLIERLSDEALIAMVKKKENSRILALASRLSLQEKTEIFCRICPYEGIGVKSIGRLMKIGVDLTYDNYFPFFLLCKYKPDIAVELEIDVSPVIDEIKEIAKTFGHKQLAVLYK